MANEIFYKDVAPTALTATAGTLADQTAVLLGLMDLRGAGSVANLILNFEMIADILCKFTTITGIIARKVVADLYLVPAVDGTNFADVDTTSGASYIPSNYRVGSFIAPFQFVTATNVRMATAQFDAYPLKYNAYLQNVAGQTMTAGAVVTIAPARVQYT